MTSLWLLPVLLMLTGVAPLTGQSVCDLPVCECGRGVVRVVCECDGTTNSLAIGETTSLPPRVSSLTVRDCEVVEMLPLQFIHQIYLENVTYANITTLKLSQDLYVSQNAISVYITDIHQLDFMTTGVFKNTQSFREIVLDNVAIQVLKNSSMAEIPIGRQMVLRKIKVIEVQSKGLEVVLSPGANVIIEDVDVGFLRSGGIRISGGARFTVRDSHLTSVETESIEAAVDAFEFVDNTVQDLQSHGLAVTALAVNISSNRFTGLFGDRCLSRVTFNTNLTLSNNTILTPLGQSSLLLGHNNRSEQVRIAGNRLQCHCEDGQWIRSDPLLWRPGLNTSWCLGVPLLPSGAQCNVTAGQFFSRTTCTEEFTCSACGQAGATLALVSCLVLLTLLSHSHV